MHYMKYALVTGASSGIGLMYARELASRGYDLVIVSNQENEIKQAAEDIAKDFSVKAHPIFMDLTDDMAAENLLQYCKDNGIEIEVLINNAGVFFFNPIIKTARKRVDVMLDLHVKTVAHMCQVFGADMAERGHGYILNMSSMSAWMTMPGINVYNSTKSFILNFSRSLWYELKPLGVTVTAVCPGAVDTGLYGLSDYWRKIAVGIGVSMRPEKLVKRALRAMFRGKKQCMPGLVNHLFVPLIKHLPDWFVFAVIKRLECFQK